VRQFAAVLLSCALFSSVLLAGSPHEAYAQGYSGQAVVEDAQSYVGTSYGTWGMDCSGFASACQHGSFAALSARQDLGKLKLKC
jgi:hypothetical protein